MAAAVADFRPASRGRRPRSRRAAPGSPAPIALVRNPDVLRRARRPPRAPGQVVVGFAAETGDADGDVLAHGRAKLAAQGLRPARRQRRRRRRGVRGRADNAAVVLGADGGETEVPRGPKDALADAVWDLVRAHGE